MEMLRLLLSDRAVLQRQLNRVLGIASLVRREARKIGAGLQKFDVVVDEGRVTTSEAVASDDVEWVV